MASNKSHGSGVTRPASPTPITVQATQAQVQSQQMPPQLQPQVNTMNPANANQAPNDQNTPVQPGGVTALTQMTDDELANLVIASKSAIMPNFLSDVDDVTQKFVYQAGMNELPEVMDAASFGQFLSDNNIPQSQVLARGVDDITYSAGGHSMKLSAQNVLDMMMYSKYNYIGGKVGGQRFGAGTYFAMNGGRSTGYGSQYAVAAMNPAKARVIDESTLRRKAAAFAKTHPKFNRAIGGFVDSNKWTNNNMSVWALVMGYNVIKDPGDSRTNVIDRSVLVYRK